MKASFSVQGGSDLDKRLSQLGAAASRKVQVSALKAAAEPIRSRAAALAPREPGKPDIADNIVTQALSESAVDRDVDLLDGTVVAIGPRRGFFYGSFLEFGTMFQPAQPFMRPAFDGGEARAQSILRDALWAAIRKVAGTSGASAGSSGGRFV